MYTIDVFFNVLSVLNAISVALKDPSRHKSSCQVQVVFERHILHSLYVLPNNYAQNYVKLSAHLTE